MAIPWPDGEVQASEEFFSGPRKFCNTIISLSTTNLKTKRVKGFAGYCSLLQRDAIHIIIEVTVSYCSRLLDNMNYVESSLVAVSDVCKFYCRKHC